jgi:hypothetical protein
MFLRFVKQIADTTGANSDKHFDELGPGDPEKWHASFARYRTCEQCLACSGRTNQQHAAWNACAELGKFRWFLQEFDDFLQLLERFVHAGHVEECNAWAGRVRHTRLSLAERLHRIPAAAREPTHGKQRQTAKQEQG